MQDNQIPEEKHDHGPLKFPKDFLWGTSTSAHQVEGNNTNSDWWKWEQKREPKMRSGKAADEYNLFELDFDLARDLGLNAQRISIEWSRIQPLEGIYDQNAIDHYIKVLKELKKRNFKVMLTLWHFTLPLWVAEKGGWENPKTIGLFNQFVEKIVPEIKEYVDLWITLNEPTVYAYMGYVEGLWPPQKKSNLIAFEVVWNLAQAHKKSYETLHKLIPGVKVGIAHNIQSFETYHKHSITELLAVGFGDFFTNHLFYALTHKHHDFLGINYYFHHRFNRADTILPEVMTVDDTETDVSDLGWEVYPEGLFEVLTDLADHIDIYITECGIASTNDDRRTRFLINYLSETYRGIKEKIPVKGFFYWSLIDNFEWHQGFEPRFGLIEVDYETQERKIRPSAYVYQEIIKNNGIPHSLLRLLGHTVTVPEVLCYLHKGGPKGLCEHLTSSRYPRNSKEIKIRKK